MPRPAEVTLQINVKGISAGSGPLFSAPCGRPHVAFNNDNLTGFYNKSSVALESYSWLYLNEFQTGKLFMAPLDGQRESVKLSLL
jgi:hypothetical protein